MRVLLIAALFVATVCAKEYSVLYESNKWIVKEGNHFLDAVAHAKWEDTREKDGWTRLHLTISKVSRLSNEQKYYGAGFLEGYINQYLIFAAYYNFANGTGLPITPAMQQLIVGQQSWMKAEVSSNAASDPYWNHLSLYLQQFQGIVDGYAAAAPANQKLTQLQLWTYALQFEIGDIMSATGGASRKHPVFATPQVKRRDMGEHCSVIVKLADRNERLLHSHITWSAFNTMLRVYKVYDFPLVKVQFSSYPGLPFSGDDWVLNSHEMSISETTNEVFNMSCYKYTTAQTVPYFLRVQVASEADTPQKWHDTFKRYNSGTYNNQWQILSVKHFVPGKPLPNGSFWLGEQAPGLYVAKDMTSYLNENRYWGSYNVAYFPEVWYWSGYEPMYQKYGNPYSWSMCARAQIYRRDQHKVQDLDSLKRIQRYNQYQTDPLSLHDACRGIAARCDLNTPWANNTLNGMAAFGAIDAKVADHSMIRQMKTQAVSGPTYDSQPIFWWGNQWSSVPHKELPQIYAFDFVEMK